MNIFGFKNKEKKSSINKFYQIKNDCQISNLETYYLKYFGQKKEGFFIEMGSFDGDSYSNTCFLADLGWDGIYIEPVPEFAKKCENRHQGNKVKILNIGVGDKKEEVSINVSGELSTIDQNTMENFKKMDWAKDIISTNFLNVKINTLNNILTEYKVKKKIDLLVIDVEGYELRVLLGFDIRKWLPKMVIIELHDQNPNYTNLKNDSEEIVK